MIVYDEIAVFWWLVMRATRWFERAMSWLRCDRKPSLFRGPISFRLWVWSHDIRWWARGRYDGYRWRQPHALDALRPLGDPFDYRMKGR